MYNKKILNRKGSINIESINISIRLIIRDNMLWTYKNNQIIFYEVKVNKSKLKEIRDEIIEKYANKEKIIRNFSIIRDIPIKCIVKTNKYNQNYPKLAIILDNLILDKESGLYELYQFKNGNLFSDEDKYGTEYIDEVIENISFEKLHEEKFKNAYEMLEKLIQNSENIRTDIENINQTMVPYQVVNELHKEKMLRKGR